MSNRNKGLKWNADNYWQSSNYNTSLYLALRNQIMNMALTRFKWVNLPETCDERYLELMLLNQGIATIAYPRQEAGKWRSLQVSGWQKTPDMYGNPRMWNALGMNGFQFNVTKNNGYFCWDNHLRVPTFDRIDIWIRELVDIVRTMQQNRAHLKVPVLLYGPQEKQLDIINIAKQANGGEAFILATDGIEKIEVKALDTKVQFYGTELWQNFLNVWTQIYQGLGIGNLPFKAERQIEDEVQSQSDPTDLVALDALTCRREMCDYLNNHFKTFKLKPLKVVWRSDNATDNFNIMNNLKEMMELKNGDDTDVA